MSPSVFFWMLISNALFVSASRDQFRYWFPVWRETFTSVIGNECAGPYHDYLTKSSTSSVSATFVTPVIDCIMDNISESLKAKMASAVVVLGITPTILSFLGSTATEVSLLSLRRPILSLLLAVGSPSVCTTRAFEYQEPKEVLEIRKGRAAVPKLSSSARIFVSVFEGLLALGAVANVIDLSYRVGERTVSSFLSGSTFMPLIWNFLAVLLFCLGALTLRLRTRQITTDRRPALKGRMRRWVSDELTTCASQRPLILEWTPESYLFLFMSWITSIGAVLHIVFGTVVLSGVLFISILDSISVTARYILSSLCCRMILTYELAGLREALLADSSMGLDTIEYPDASVETKKSKGAESTTLPISRARHAEVVHR